MSGPNIATENTLKSCEKCFELGFEVELDVWKLNDALWLSHNFPNTRVERVPNWLLERSDVWWHAKNLSALQYLLDKKKKVFWHTNDKYTLTSNNKIWTYPGEKLTEISIAVLPEESMQKIPKSIFGVCTDFPQNVDKYLFN